MSMHTVTVNGTQYTVSVDASDYPEIIIEGIFDEDDNEVEETPELLDDLYAKLSVAVASSMVDAAVDRMKDR